MAEKPIRITEPNLLVVEGKDECNFFEKFKEHLKLQNIQVLDIGGKSQFRDRLRALSKSPDFKYIKSIGIVRDADTNSESAFNSVCYALQSANLPIPKRPLKPVGNKPKVIVMILPREGEPGMLEDLCLNSVESDPAISCVEQYFQCLQENSKSFPNNVSKAKVQVFLASRQKVVNSVGIAALKNYWPFDDEAFDHVKNFLEQIVA